MEDYEDYEEPECPFERAEVQISESMNEAASWKKRCGELEAELEDLREGTATARRAWEASKKLMANEIRRYRLALSRRL